MSEPALVADSVSKSFESTGGPEVLRGLSLEVAGGEAVAITGASGCGKSTLLHILAGLAEPDSGSVSVAGESMSDAGPARRGEIRNRSVGFVYQFHHLLAEFTAAENVAMPMLVAGRERGEAGRRAEEMLGRIGLSDRAGMLPSRLSGGERQRVAILRALANGPDCVIADEPTGNLDRRTADAVAALMIDSCRSSGCALVVATHDIDLADRIGKGYEMRDGSLAARGAKEETDG